MRFKNEVRKFMEEMRLVFIKEKTVIEEQGRMILLLQGQNKHLLDRLMARDYPELQTYSLVNYSEKPTMDFDSDEELVGTIVDSEPTKVEG